MARESRRRHRRRRGRRWRRSGAAASADVEGRFDLLDSAGGVLWREQRLLPDPDRDLDIPVLPPISNVSAVPFTSLTDRSDEPGFSELEVFGP